MSLFSYRALDTRGKTVEGSTSSTSREEVASELQNKGLTPLAIKQVSQGSSSDKSIPLIEKINFCRYISSMLKAGLSINESISVIAEEATNATAKKIYDDIIFGIKNGQNLSTIMARYPNSFDNFFVTIIKAGEVGGTLAQSFNQIEAELRSEHDLKQKVGGALMYPAVVFSAMIGIGLLMVFYIMPQIGQVFINMNLQLAAPTRLMFEAVLVISKYKIYILSVMFALLIFLVIFFRTKLGKKTIMAMISPMPVVNNLIKQIDIARFCRGFSTLISSGVPITQALEISLSSLSYTKYRNLGPKIVADVSRGQTLSASIKAHKIFPPLLTQMIAAGESSGTIDETLKDLGEFYQEEVESGVKKATQLLEPLIMLLVGVGVGIMILSVISPIYSVVSSIQQGG